MARYRFLIQQLSGPFEGCEFHHVPRAENEVADMLAKIGSTRQAIPADVSLEQLHKPSIKLSPESASIFIPADSTIQAPPTLPVMPAMDPTPAALAAPALNMAPAESTVQAPSAPPTTPASDPNPAPLVHPTPTTAPASSPTTTKNPQRRLGSHSRCAVSPVAAPGSPDPGVGIRPTAGGGSRFRSPSRLLDAAIDVVGLKAVQILSDHAAVLAPLQDEVILGGVLGYGAGSHPELLLHDLQLRL
ncbi:hypothetical protein ZWY2020_003776 [Hordeum vulgare]|nr:hypothetical protein ZWY2020_003776 [Hordeum vulgare]